MFCEQCGKQIADGDAFCQECGWKVPVEEVAAEAAAVVEEVKEEAAQAVEEVIATAEETTAPVEEVVEEVTEVAEKAAAPVEEAVAETTEAVKETAASVEEAVAPAAETVAAPAADSVWATASNDAPAAEPAKKKSGKVIGIILALVAVIAILLIIAVPKVIQFGRATFSAPEDYYAYVEEKQISKLVADYMSYYEVYMEEASGIENGTSAKTTFTVELGEELRELVTDAGVELEWLESVNLVIDANIKEEAMQLSALLGANKVDVISGNMIIDFDGEGVYMQSPELNKKYLGADFDALGLSDSDTEELTGMFEMTNSLVQSMPDSKVLEELLNKYVGIVLEQIGDVEKEKTTLEVGDIAQKCTALEITIDSETLQNIVEAVLEEVAEDKDLEEIFTQFVGSEYMELAAGESIDADELYDYFIEEVEYMLDNIDDIDMGEEEIIMTVYVDGSGDVIGREVEVAGAEFRYAMPKKGSKFEMECYVKVPDMSGAAVSLDGEAAEVPTTKIGIEGAGKLSGSKMSGDFSVKAMGMKFVDIAVEDYNAEKGEMKGKFTITLSDGLVTLLEGEMGSEAAVISPFLDYSLVVEMDTNTKGGMMSLAVMDKEDLFAKITLESESGKSKKISIPAEKNVYDMTDEDDVEDWLDEIDWDKLLEKLEKKVGVDSDYIDLLEDALDELN